jgi:hypothetical protein
VYVVAGSASNMLFDECAASRSEQADGRRAAHPDPAQHRQEVRGTKTTFLYVASHNGSAALCIGHRGRRRRKICRLVSASRMIRQFRALKLVPGGRLAGPI